MWLTEFGSWQAWCPGIRLLQFEDTGIPCDPALNDDIDYVWGQNNGPCIDDNHDDLEWGRDVFYGRNHREGIWGLQTEQIRYLTQQNRWDIAWWFVSVASGYNPCSNIQLPKDQLLCDTTAWIWGDSFYCTQAVGQLGQGGIIYHNVLDCLLNGYDCPPDLE